MIDDSQINGQDVPRVTKFAKFDSFDLPSTTVKLHPESFGKVQPRNKRQQQIIKSVDNKKIEKQKINRPNINSIKKHIVRSNQCGLKAVEEGNHGYEWYPVSGMGKPKEIKKVQISPEKLNVIGSTFRYGQKSNNKNGRGLSGAEKAITMIPGGSKTFTKSTVYGAERVISASGLGNGHQYYNNFG